MVRYVGGIITTANTDPTTSASSGVWQIQEALTNIQGETWQVPLPAGRALFGGAVPNAHKTDIDYIDINTTGNAQDFGDVSFKTYSGGGCSDSHGGLGGY